MYLVQITDKWSKTADKRLQRISLMTVYPQIVTFHPSSVHILFFYVIIATIAIPETTDI